MASRCWPELVRRNPVTRPRRLVDSPCTARHAHGFGMNSHEFCCYAPCGRQARRDKLRRLGHAAEKEGGAKREEALAEAEMGRASQHTAPVFSFKLLGR